MPNDNLAARLGELLTERDLWRAGMQTREQDASKGQGRVLFVHPGSPFLRCSGFDAIRADCTPDLTDPATAGCLHALACEVFGPMEILYALGRWVVLRAGEPIQPRAVGTTPGEALARLLLEVA